MTTQLLLRDMTNEELVSLFKKYTKEVNWAKAALMRSGTSLLWADEIRYYAQMRDAVKRELNKRNQTITK